MSARASVIVGVSVILCCLILGLSFGGPAAGQQAPPPTSGRYQVIVKAGSQNTAVFVFDSTTGQCWFRDTNPQVKDWTDMGSPVIKVNK